MGAGSGLTGKLVEMKGMGGEVSSVVCKTRTLPFIGQPPRTAMGHPTNVTLNHRKADLEKEEYFAQCSNTKKKKKKVTNTILPEKTGLSRLFEALEANEWAATANADDDVDFDGSSGSPDLLFGAELDSNEDELGAALLDETPPKGDEQKGEDGGEGEGDRQVFELERMMIRMQAVKGKSSIPFTSFA